MGEKKRRRRKDEKEKKDKRRRRTRQERMKGYVKNGLRTDQARMN